MRTWPRTSDWQSLSHACVGSVLVCTGSLLLLTTDLLTPSGCEVSPSLLICQPSQNFHAHRGGPRQDPRAISLTLFVFIPPETLVSEWGSPHRSLGCWVLAPVFMPPPSFRVQSCGGRKEKTGSLEVFGLWPAFLPSYVCVSPAPRTSLLWDKLPFPSPVYLMPKP